MKKVLFLFVALFMLNVSCSYGGEVEKYTYTYDLRKVFVAAIKTGESGPVIGRKIPIDKNRTGGYGTTSVTMEVHEKDQIQEIPYVIFDFRDYNNSHFNYKYHITEPIINEDNLKVYNITTGGIVTPLLGIRTSKEDCEGALIIIKTSEIDKVLADNPKVAEFFLMDISKLEGSSAFSKGGYTILLSISAKNHSSELAAMQYYFDAYRMSSY